MFRGKRNCELGEGEGGKIYVGGVFLRQYQYVITAMKSQLTGLRVRYSALAPYYYYYYYYYSTIFWLP